MALFFLDPVRSRQRLINAVAFGHLSATSLRTSVIIFNRPLWDKSRNPRQTFFLWAGWKIGLTTRPGIRSWQSSRPIMQFASITYIGSSCSGITRIYVSRWFLGRVFPFPRYPKSSHSTLLRLLPCLQQGLRPPEQLPS